LEAPQAPQRSEHHGGELETFNLFHIQMCYREQFLVGLKESWLELRFFFCICVSDGGLQKSKLCGDHARIARALWVFPCLRRSSWGGTTGSGYCTADLAQWLGTNLTFSHAHDMAPSALPTRNGNHVSLVGHLRSGRTRDCRRGQAPLGSCRDRSHHRRSFPGNYHQPAAGSPRSTRTPSPTWATPRGGPCARHAASRGRRQHGRPRRQRPPWRGASPGRPPASAGHAAAWLTDVGGAAAARRQGGWHRTRRPSWGEVPPSMRRCGAAPVSCSAQLSPLAQFAEVYRECVAAIRSGVV